MNAIFATALLLGLLTLNCDASPTPQNRPTPCAQTCQAQGEISTNAVNRDDPSAEEQRFTNLINCVKQCILNENILTTNSD
ncbi:unnamed protein product [Dicrocoelium dendriticum]|nr:unnamed protein product [Dicrocoelium dendriticum]